MLTDLVKVGTKYFTRADDLVEIVRQLHLETGEGHTHHYDAKVLRVINGHEALMGQVLHYTADGCWLNPEGQTVASCIHDLKEEACHDAE
jgi:hypothetical protein